MRIIVMGGAGDMGSRAVEELSQTEGIGQVTIADRNRAAASRIAEELKGRNAKVDVATVDADDHAGLVRAMKRYDIAVSALGPFYLFEAKLVEAALEAGVHYTSINDDWLAADQVITRFSDRARERGITVITGLGTSPGISNMGIRHFANQLDRVRRVEVSVYLPLDGGGGEAVIGHTLFITSGRIALWRKGRRMMVSACSETRMLDFPRFGRQKVWNMGHGEPVTVPLFLPGLEEVNFFMGFGKGSNLIVIPARLGLFNGQARRRVFTKLFRWTHHMGRQKDPEWGAVRIDVWGEKDGREVYRQAFGIGQMREATGLSLAVGTIMLARGETLTDRGGVYAPEACLDPVRFLTYLKERGIPSYYDLDMTQPVV